MEKITVIGCKHTTKDLILGLKRFKIQVNHCITIDPEKGKSQNVAGYYDLSKFLKEQDIPCSVVPSYKLDEKLCKPFIKTLAIDLLLVMGWQRLIPDWVLKHLKVGAFGMHGSSKPLPHGRGRSPLNWSLIQNKKIFFTHLFQYLPGVDDGPIVGVQTFDITAFDDCHTLHFKNTVSMIKLCSQYVPLLLTGHAKCTEQAKEGICYYPKRTAEDGIIFWHDSTQDIYNLIRAVTKPFPGAFSFLKTNKMIIFKAIPFDTRINYPDATCGEVLEVFYDGSFVVKTGDSTLLVQHYEGNKLLHTDIGQVFHCNGIKRKIWQQLPA